MAENKIKYGIKGECQNAKLDKKKNKEMKWKLKNQQLNKRNGRSQGRKKRYRVRHDNNIRRHC